VPLHLSPMGRKWGYKEGDLPRTEDLAVRLLRLPMNYYVTPENQAEIVQAISDYFGA
jgi:dTDP-4-amino-4,6-dideoxygalactose transaminase